MAAGHDCSDLLGSMVPGLESIPSALFVHSHSVDENTQAGFHTELSLLQVASCLTLHKNVS